MLKLHIKVSPLDFRNFVRDNSRAWEFITFLSDLQEEYQNIFLFAQAGKKSKGIFHRGAGAKKTPLIAILCASASPRFFLAPTLVSFYALH